MNQDSVRAITKLTISEKIAFTSGIFSIMSVALGSLSMVLKLVEGDGKVEPMFFHNQQQMNQRNTPDNLYSGRSQGSSGYFNN